MIRDEENMTMKLQKQSLYKTLYFRNCQTDVWCGIRSRYSNGYCSSQSDRRHASFELGVDNYVNFQSLLSPLHIVGRGFKAKRWHVRPFVSCLSPRQLMHAWNYLAPVDSASVALRQPLHQQIAGDRRARRWSGVIVLIYKWRICTETLWTQTRQSNARNERLSCQPNGVIHMIYSPRRLIRGLLAIHVIMVSTDVMK